MASKLSPAARLGVAFAGLVLVGMLAVLIAVLFSLEATRSEIRTTRATMVEAELRFQRVTQQLDPLLGDGGQARLARRGRELSDAVGELPGLAQDARAGLDAALVVAGELDGAELGGTLTAVRSALSGLSAPPAGSMKACDDRLRRGSPTAPGQAGCLLRSVPNIRSLLRSQRRLNRISTITQKRQLSITQRTYELLAESLAVQRETLERARSIDRKTGGPPPAVPTLP